MEILKKINSSSDVKRLDGEETIKLCAELRQSIIENVSKTGGHLASNLGAVELTVALHRVYDTSRDRLVFDVGHQCYAHKMLTGRADKFSGLRQLGGISGFPKPCESRDDACISGHASTAISNALGMARARTLMGDDYDVVAVVGDGAMTGGLSYEGLADCGQSGEPMVIILNDNEMSISKNVGGMAQLLSAQRVKPSYIKLKKLYWRTIGRCGPLYSVLHRLKEWIKDLFLPDNMFEDMGLYYLGPIDGHDVRTLERTIGYARDLRMPVLLHVVTVKGKGYPPAERRPALYHGVNPFDPATGITEESKTGFSEVFGGELERLAKGDERIVAITAAMGDGTGLSEFEKAFPNRFFDVGIAEEHAVSLAAGMAKQGLRPVFAVYSSFLQRGFDMLIHDVGLSSLPVTLAVDRAGIVGADGETHQGVFDVGYLSQIPNMKIFAPSSYAELRSMLGNAVQGAGPAAIRYPRVSEGAFKADSSGKNALVVKAGSDVTIVSYGIMINQALSAAESLAARGISAEVIKLNRLDAPDFELIKGSVFKTGAVIVAEDAAEAGCIGVRVLASLTDRPETAVKARLLNLGSGVVEHGGVIELWKKYGIDADAIVAAAEGMNEKSKN